VEAGACVGDGGEAKLSRICCSGLEFYTALARRLTKRSVEERSGEGE